MSLSFGKKNLHIGLATLLVHNSARTSMRYITVECECFSAKFVPNPALLPELVQHGTRMSAEAHCHALRAIPNYKMRGS